jgi:hypothetical protein
MKKWRDADEVIKMTIEVPEDLKEYAIEMQKKPNFDKRENKVEKKRPLKIKQDKRKINY